MRWFKRLFLRRRIYGDLSDEIREHLEEKIQQFQGMSRKEAAAAARREFGNVTLSEENSREVWRWPSTEDFFMEIRYRLRCRRGPHSCARHRRECRDFQPDECATAADLACQQTIPIGAIRARQVGR